MKQRTVLFVSAVLAVASTLATCYDGIDFSYVDWNDLPGRYTSSDVTRNALSAIKIQDFDGAADIRTKMMQSLQNDKSTSYREIYRDLLMISNHFTWYSKERLLRVLEVCSIIYNEKSGLGHFSKFLKFYGKDTFGELSLDAARELDEIGSVENEEALQELEKFFAPFFIPEPTNEGEMVNALKSLNFASSKFDIKERVGHLLGKKASSCEEALSIFLGRIEELCRKLLSDNRRTEDMRIITLADAFGYSNRQDSIRILKLKEYNRLCVSVRRPDTRKEVETHLKGLLRS